MKSIALQITKIYMKELQALRVVEEVEVEEVEVVHTKSMGKNVHRAKNAVKVE